MKNLAGVSPAEQKAFLEGVDNILCDIDGVLSFQACPIPGADLALKSLRKLKKNLYFVTNNSIIPLDTIYNNMVLNKLEPIKDNIVVPTKAMVSYLKEINFKKSIYLLGGLAQRIELENNGFTVVPKDPSNVGENVLVLLTALNLDESVGAVIIDIDINVNYVSLQKATNYLKKADVLFILGATDHSFPMKPGFECIGPGSFAQILIEHSGHKPDKIFSKPSKDLSGYITKTYNIKDPSRTLFVGDSILADMAFASNCAYKKLLVLTGLDKGNALENWTDPEEYKPDYYLDSISTLTTIIANVYNVSP